MKKFGTIGSAPVDTRRGPAVAPAPHMRPLLPLKSRMFRVVGLQGLTRMSLLVIVLVLIAGGCSRDSADAGESGTGGTSAGGVGGSAGAGGGAGDHGNVGGNAGAYHLRAPAQHRVSSDVCSVDRGAGGTGGPVYCGAGGGTGQLCTGLNPACCLPPPQPGNLSVPYCTVRPVRYGFGLPRDEHLQLRGRMHAQLLPVRRVSSRRGLRGRLVLLPFVGLVHLPRLHLPHAQRHVCRRLGLFSWIGHLQLRFGCRALAVLCHPAGRGLCLVVDSLPLDPDSRRARPLEQGQPRPLGDHGVAGFEPPRRPAAVPPRPGDRSCRGCSPTLRIRPTGSSIRPGSTRAVARDR